jgi:hypothetical protein
MYSTSPPATTGERRDYADRDVFPQPAFAKSGDVILVAMRGHVDVERRAVRGPLGLLNRHFVRRARGRVGSAHSPMTPISQVQGPRVLGAPDPYAERAPGALPGG